MIISAQAVTAGVYEQTFTAPSFLLANHLCRGNRQVRFTAVL
jgi:hypothetical protein